MSRTFSRTSATLVVSNCANIPLIETVLLCKALWLCWTNRLTKLRVTDLHVVNTPNEPAKPMMKIYLLVLLCLTACSAVAAEDKNNDYKENMNSYKKDVTLWYEAFTKKDPALVDRILHETWVDIPAAPGTPAGPAGVKPLLTRLTTTFPDLKLTIEDILQDGNKVVVRARMAGTQKEAFMDLPSKNRKMDIQVVDIHEFKDGKIVRTWHTEDWMSGLRQLGVFEK
jgi:steroid delta-isomerase-like uncharacterized protein